jgi:two-component system, cell cycle sensor histidine kinase and response regulator CckA
LALSHGEIVILLVDDEEGYRELIARVLTKAGYEVLQAADGLEALSLLEKSKVDLVISDILMPALNGYALVARLRARWPKMPVILTTGFLSQESAKSMMNGSVDFIPKPIIAETLLDMIQRRTPPPPSH